MYHILLAVLAGRGAATDPGVGDEEVFTTGSWWYRFARAVQDPQFSGALSRKVVALPPDVRRKVLTSLEELPPEIGVLEARVLIPVMAALSQIGRFNPLHAEALATALVLLAGLRVVAASDLLRSACSTLGSAQYSGLALRFDRDPELASRRQRAALPSKVLMATRWIRSREAQISIT